MKSDEHEATPSAPGANLAGQVQSALTIVGLAAAAASGIAVAASVVYELSYFSVLGFDLIRFASIQDYVINALPWLPVGAVYLTVFAWMQSRPPSEQSRSRRSESALPSSDTGRLEAVVDPSTLSKMLSYRLKATIRRNQLLIIIGYLVVLIFIMIFLSGSPSIVIAVFVILSSAFFGFLVMLTPMAVTLNQSTFGAIAAFLGIVFLIALGGVSESTNLGNIRKPVPLDKITVMGSPSREVILLRVYDKGILTMSPDRASITFLDWKEVESIESTVDWSASRLLQ